MRVPQGAEPEAARSSDQSTTFDQASVDEAALPVADPCPTYCRRTAPGSITVTWAALAPAPLRECARRK